MPVCASLCQFVPSLCQFVLIEWLHRVNLRQPVEVAAGSEGQHLSISKPPAHLRRKRQADPEDVVVGNEAGQKGRNFAQSFYVGDSEEV